MKVQPLKTEAKWLSPEARKGRSAASSPDLSTLAERFAEPLRDANKPASIADDPAPAASRLRLVRSRDEANAAAPSPEPNPVAARKKSGVPIKGLITALVGIALVPTAILFVLLWQDAMDPRGGHSVAPAEQKSAARLSAAPESEQPRHAPSPLEVALTSPDLIQADNGEIIDFPIAIDATGALPARSIVAITALPHGASFSSGRPFGVNGWSLRPDEIGDLQLRLPALAGASDMRLELIAGDGTVLAQSDTKVSIAPPVEVATVASVDRAPADAVLSNPFEQVAATDATGSIENAPEDAVAKAELAQSAPDAPPLPDRKPASRVAATPGVKVNTVKVVTITPPPPARPYDGAYALGSPADETQAPAEWMETKTAVDMHAKAEQSSETVKVADTGLKVRVLARDKNWVQVKDPKSSTTGWIYNRFLKPADPPAR